MNIKKSLRIIFRNKIYSFLNIVGLAVGITSVALIFLWVEDKVSFNNAIPNSRNIYIASRHNLNSAGQYSTFFSSGYPLSKVLDDDFPEVKRNACISMTSLIFVPENRTDSFEESGWYADSTLFTIAGMKFISGDPSSAFNKVHSIVISQSLAKKIFGTDDPIGKGLLNDGQPYEITGVFKDMPVNTTFQFDWLAPFQIYADYVKERMDINGWGSIWLGMYVELEPNVDIKKLNEKLKPLAMERGGPNYANAQIFLYPLNKILLYGKFENGLETGGGYNKTVRLFFLIGILILVIACINFMNLSTARSQKRALEVGVRKTFGTKKKYLIRQFLAESGLITAIALLISIGLVWLSLPFFNDLIDAKLSFDLSKPVILLGLITIGLFCTLLAGSYPALYLSSFNPITTLKMQKVEKGGRAVWIRQGLVVFQFTMAFILICTTYVIYLQIQLAQTRDVGIEKENLVTFPVSKELMASYSAVQNELANTGVVESSGFTSQPLIYMGLQAAPWHWMGKDPDDDKSIRYNFVSEGLVGAAGIKLVDGTDLDPERKPYGVLINEAQARRMGNAGRVGEKIGQTPEMEMEIIGIMKDYLFDDPYSIEASPVIFFHSPARSAHLFVRLKQNIDYFEAIGRVQSVLQTFTPHYAFDATPMSDRFNRMFNDDRLIEKLSALFAALAIFISCLGLLGLSAFSAEQRTKEIGVRKVLGAKIADILVLLGKAYTGLLFISFVIGIPISLYLADYYLKDYAYRIILSWDIFAGVALFIAIIAIMTVSFQSLKAALANPVKSIKTE